MYTKRTTILTLLQFSLDIRSIIGKTATNRRLFVIVCLLLVVSFQATHRVLWNSNKASNHIFLLIREAAYFLAFFWLSFYFSGLSEPILAQFSRNNWEYSYSKENANQNFSQPKGRREDLALCMSKCQGILKIKILLNQQVAIVSLVLSCDRTVVSQCTSRGILNHGSHQHLSVKYPVTYQLHATSSPSEFPNK